MKVALLVDDTLDKPDGVQQYVLTVGKWLAGQGHEVHYLVGFSRRTDIPNVHSLARNVQVRFNRNRLSIPLPVSKTKMKKLLEREQYDILHVQMPYSPLFAGRLVSAVPRTTAVVGTFHILPYSSFEKTASRVLARMEKGSLKKLHATMSVSRPTAEFAEIVFGIISQIVPNVIDTSMFKGAARLKKYDAYTNIVFLGRLVERKGVMQLLEAVHLNASKFKRQKVKVLICGRGPLESKARQFVTNKSLSEIVEIKGFVSEKEKPKYLASADIAVFPSLSGESFGIVLLEAIAAGASCVVAGDNPGYNSVLVDMPEVLCDPKDSKKFADLLTKLVSDTKLRARIGLKQKALITAYEVGTVGPEILKVYKSAIAKSKEKTHN